MVQKPDGSRGPREELPRDGTLLEAADGSGGEPWIVPFLLLRAREEGDLTTEVALGLGGGRAGEVRPVIRGMEGEGLLVSRGGTRYAITDLGEAYLRSWAGSLERDRKDADLFLRAYAERRSERDLAGERG